MNLGQMMLVVVALSILGILVLTANKSVLSSSEVTEDSDFGITAVSLATSIAEEALGQYYDQNCLTGAADSLALYTPPGSLGPGGGEKFASSTTRFNDFDDYNGLFVVYKSDNPNDNTPVAGADTIITVPGLRSRYYVKATVGYVDNLDPSGSYLSTTSYTKRMDIKVWRPAPPGVSSKKDTLWYPVVMSYWR